MQRQPRTHGLKNPSSEPTQPRLPRTPKQWVVLVGILALLAGLISAGSILTLSWIGYQPSTTIKQLISDNPNTIINRPEYISILGTNTENKILLFYPGAAITSSAYTGLLYQLRSSYRYIVIPKFIFNLAVTDASKGDKVLELARKDFGLTETKWKEYPLYIAGHSLGGAMLMEWYKNSSFKNQLRGVIFMASYPASSTLKDSKIAALFVYGEVDGVIDRNKLKQSQLEWQGSELKVIEGMNHAQWGDYGDQLGDTRAISTLQVSQNSAVQLIKIWSDLKR